MCGITGIFAFNEIGRFFSINVAKSNATLSKRGPDYANLYADDRVHLGHSRLSIIDLDYRANQPMQDESQRYVIVYNGEIFNYRALRQQLQAQGVSFFSESDTEVLLKLYMRYGADCLAQLNGFFAFAIYDRQAQSLFLARDRFGVKPLLYYMDEDKFLFASEMKALLSYGLEKQIDNDSLLFYLQLNYIPAPHTI
ncbi:MAG TPA: asparagine synthetase B, partial [Microscillaceae bacterium]|nr:asparagine synthetase B [Microscillaceae bacterium]